MAQDERTSPYRIAGTAAIVVGLLLVACGMVWNWVVPNNAFWTERDAHEYAEATDAVHAAISRPANPPTNASPNLKSEDLESAKARLVEVEHRLQMAKNGRKYGGIITSLVGITLVISGALALRY